MRYTFAQEGPDGSIVSKVTTKNARETIAMYEWMFDLRSKGYKGPFLLKSMLEKIRKENTYEKR